MRRPFILVALIGVLALLALKQLLQTPATVGDVLSHPFQAVIGTQEQLNSTLLDVSENGEPVRAAGRRLLKPLGLVRLDRVYDTSDSSSTKNP